MVILRNLDAHECYSVHKDVARELVGSPDEYIRAKCLDPLEPWVTLERNRFPYRGCEDSHWILWVHPGCQMFWTPGRVSEVVGGWFHVWENPVATKSIHGVLHYHIIPTPPSQPHGAGCPHRPTLYAQYT